MSSLHWHQELSICNPTVTACSNITNVSASLLMGFLGSALRSHKALHESLKLGVKWLDLRHVMGKMRTLQGPVLTGQRHCPQQLWRQLQAAASQAHCAHSRPHNAVACSSWSPACAPQQCQSCQEQSFLCGACHKETQRRVVLGGYAQQRRSEAGQLA